MNTTATAVSVSTTALAMWRNNHVLVVTSCSTHSRYRWGNRPPHAYQSHCTGFGLSTPPSSAADLGDRHVAGPRTTLGLTQRERRAHHGAATRRRVDGERAAQGAQPVGQPGQAAAGAGQSSAHAVVPDPDPQP